ncbi:ribonuclease G [Maritimibacter sp. 55A14]|uniref:ribonuclease E/G n=1 Tax=Maritimibacter sp. 55A14 TaxID=2174844 RepID=UPI000D616E98|nr:ribonuclease E/G [Maritimibacter sp. 55A14]PWE32176.1 ribonuclease G [Maritimibacter sp. 55A14]
MKGRAVILDHIAGRRAAALMVDGRLEDFLIDPPDGAGPAPGAIFRAVADRQMKGQGGVTLRLPGGQRGYLRQAKGLSPGTALLVQVNSWAEPGKAAPVTTRLLFKSRYAIVTPGAPGLNIARRIHDEEERVRLRAIADEAMAESAEGHGLILRSAAAEVAEAAIAGDIAAMAGLAARVAAEAAGREPEALLDAPGAETLAWRDWVDPDPDTVIDRAGAFATEGVLDALAALAAPEPLQGGGSMAVEPTRALVAVDVDTGGDTSPAAGLKADLAAAKALPRALRLRGLGGQIVVDMAPASRKDRRAIEAALRAAFRDDPVETALVGWTPLGHFELQRKRERLPLTELPL